MAMVQARSLLQYLRDSAHLSTFADWTDEKVLAQYVDHGDQAAFEALMGRHGPMVLGTCRRLLNNSHDAEDAFQAVFLILVRKASTIWPRKLVGPWLHGVACRTALKAKALATKRKARENALPGKSPREESPPDDLLTVLDQELQGLPEYYRIPLILCDLEGRSFREAARQVGWPEGTLFTRLRRARQLLAKRLTRRGIGLTCGSVTTMLAQSPGHAAIPDPLAISTLTAATTHAAEPSTAFAVILMEGVLKSMMMSKLKSFIALGLVLGTLVIGGGLSALPSQSPPQPILQDLTNPEACKEQPQESIDERMLRWEKEVRQRLAKDKRLKELAATHSLALIHSRARYPGPDGSYQRSAYSFTYETADPRKHRNYVQLLFHNGLDEGSTVLHRVGTDQENVLVDLGRADLTDDFQQLRKVLDRVAIPKAELEQVSPPVSVAEGHVYLERVREGGNDYYVVFQVVAVAPENDYLAFLWRKLPGGKIVKE